MRIIKFVLKCFSLVHGYNNLARPRSGIRELPKLRINGFLFLSLCFATGAWKGRRVRFKLVRSGH